MTLSAGTEYHRISIAGLHGVLYLKNMIFVVVTNPYFSTLLSFAQYLLPALVLYLLLFQQFHGRCFLLLSHNGNPAIVQYTRPNSA